MNFRQVRTLVAAVCLAGLYFIPLWVVLWIVDVERLDVIVGGHILIVLTLVAQYWSGVRHSLKAVSAQPVDEDSRLQVLAGEVATEMGVSTPQMYVGNFGVINAFVVGRKGSGRVVLSQSMLQELSHEQVKAVIAHEISHIKSHDTTLMMLGEGIDRQLMIAKYNALAGIRGLGSALLMKPLVLVLALLRGIVLLPLRFVSRRREYLADREAATVCGDRTTAQTLETVSGLNAQVSPPKRAQQVDALCIDGVVESLVERLFGTHPPMEKRVNALRE